MPLVVLCGLPSSGKSTRAREIKQVIITRYPDKTVTIVTDDVTSIDKSRLYSSSINEKTGRADLKSKVIFKTIVNELFNYYINRLSVI